MTSIYTTMPFFTTNNIQKLFSVVLVIFTTSFLLLAPELANSQKTVSFGISNFNNAKSSISLTGNAVVLPNGVVSMTEPDLLYSVGRFLYNTPVPIWDITTGNVASFTTSFTFKVIDYKNFTPASGHVFILVPTDQAEIPSDSHGRFLGVANGNSAINQFLGVEFDCYSDTWDPKYLHIGIDTNGLISLKTTKWNRVSDSLVKVDIVYDSVSKTLNVVVTYSDGKISTLSHVVDLKAVLPNIDTVRVGFSASTHEYYRQLYEIHSWSFTSKLDTTTRITSDNNNTNTASF